MCFDFFHIFELPQQKPRGIIMKPHRRIMFRPETSKISQNAQFGPVHTSPCSSESCPGRQILVGRVALLYPRNYAFPLFNKFMSFLTNSWFFQQKGSRPRARSTRTHRIAPHRMQQAARTYMVRRLNTERRLQEGKRICQGQRCMAL